MKKYENNILNNLLTIDNSIDEPLHSTEELLEWVNERSKKLKVNIKNISLEECKPWFYDKEKGCIRNENETFFQIYGLKQTNKNKTLIEQPIIVQKEIGFLGIITCKINGTWHYLMQTKIEPGNSRFVQIAPTLQATKSNFTQKHGGKRPKYLDYFLNAKAENIIVDQIQSEQSSRFFKKRNRNIIISVNKFIPETDTHKWMTLKQIKELMKHDNLINMDTRTVISCIPYVITNPNEDVPYKNNLSLYKSVYNLDRKTFVDIYHHINNYKMFNENKTELVKLDNLKLWEMENNELVCKKPYPFKVIFCDVEIEGREVTNWKQPLLASNGKSLYGLICCNDNGVIKFLVKICPEPGCFDSIEIGPTIQNEYLKDKQNNKIENIFYKKLEQKENIMIDCILSEEGGRFYHDENRNVIIFIDKKEIDTLPKEYIWSDYGTLNILTQINNCLNIQLRNLLSLLEI